MHFFLFIAPRWAHAEKTAWEGSCPPRPPGSRISGPGTKNHVQLGAACAIAVQCSKWWWVCANIFVPAQADAFRRRNGQVSASRFFLWVCLADLVAVLWHAGQLVLSGEQAGGLRGCRWLCGPAGLGARNCTGECADGPAGGCLCGCIYLVVLSGPALPPGIGPGNAQMGQLVAGTAAAGGWQIADGRRRGARGQVVAGGGIGTH